MSPMRLTGKARVLRAAAIAALLLLLLTWQASAGPPAMEAAGAAPGAIGTLKK